MVLNYYNLREQPFGVTPDPRYLYLGATHREALASLAYGIQNSRGFLSLIASPGMGKTTILFHLLQQLESSARIAFLCQTLCKPEDIMRGVLRDLGVADGSSDMVQLEARLNEVLLAEAQLKRKVIVVIDEAQNLDDTSLELVRLLSNFETTREKLMQIVLAGQPQLGEKLRSPQLLQLHQRMSMMARLQPLSTDETRRYIAQRLRVAEYGSDGPLFTPEAEASIAKYSGGVPRTINNICFNALSLGYVLKQRPIGKDVIKEAAADLDLCHEVARRPAAPKALNISGWLAGKRSMVVRPEFAWRKIVAISALLVLALAVVFGSRWRVEARASRRAGLATAGTTVHVFSSTNAGTSAEVASNKAPTVMPPLSLAARKPEPVILEAPNRKSRAPDLNHAAVNSPDELWKKVKRHDSNAEVSLARMYLEGTRVPQNCQQAQLLLDDASRKGNTHVSELLDHYADQCH